MWPIVVAIAGFFLASCTSSESDPETRTSPGPVMDREDVQELCDLPPNSDVPALEERLFQCAQNLRSLESSGHSDFQRARSILHSLAAYSDNPSMESRARDAMRDSMGWDMIDSDGRVTVRGAAGNSLSCMWETCNGTDEGDYDGVLIFDRGLNHLLPNMRNPE